MIAFHRKIPSSDWLKEHSAAVYKLEWKPFCWLFNSKTKRGKKKPSVGDAEPNYERDEECTGSKEAVPDPKSEEYFQDEVDQFHAKREKVCDQCTTTVAERDIWLVHWM